MTPASTKTTIFPPETEFIPLKAVATTKIVKHLVQPLRYIATTIRVPINKLCWLSSEISAYSVCLFVCFFFVFIFVFVFFVFFA